MDVPLWLALLVVGCLGVKLARQPWWLVAVLVTAVAIAVAKPWSWLPAASDGPASSLSSSLAAAAPAATPDATVKVAAAGSPPPNAIACREPDGWRLATLNGVPVWYTVIPDSSQPSNRPLAVGPSNQDPPLPAV